MKRETPILGWVLANGIGLGLGFDAMLMGDFIQFGAAFDTADAPSPGFLDIGYTVIVWAVGGIVLGGAQALILRRRVARLGRWVVAASIGFGAAALVIAAPLQAAGILGRIPGPVEPIMFTIGGCTGAGLFQCLLLRRQHVPAGRWLRLWTAGLVLSLIPTVLVFFVLQALLGLELVWPVEVFINGFMCAGVAAWVSGRALFSALMQESTPTA